MGDRTRVDRNFLEAAGFPTRWDLDKISPNNPVYLTRADGHASVTNSAALKVAGITKESPTRPAAR